MDTVNSSTGTDVSTLLLSLSTLDTEDMEAHQLSRRSPYSPECNGIMWTLCESSRSKKLYSDLRAIQARKEDLAISPITHIYYNYYQQATLD